MVRAHAKQTPEEKKETQKKKVPTKKKVETGIWPCKINGCNKEFAREADLKRHQRTTKVHSLPGFACPQCEATFTRTDALRRHQKSRHNGVVIEPDQDKGKVSTRDDEAASPGSKSRSRSASPGSKGKAQASGSTSTSPGAGPSAAGPAGYYRQQGMNAEFVVFVPARNPGEPMMNTSYSTIGLPTSATRLAHPQPNWVPPPPWDAGHPMGPYHHLPGAPPGYYAPAYYRHAPGMMPPPPHHPQNPEMNSQPQTPNGLESSRDEQRDNPNEQVVDPELSEGGQAAGRPSQKKTAQVAPVIDPSLDAGGSRSAHDVPPTGSPPVSLEITQAAMQAVLEAARRQAEILDAEKAQAAARSDAEAATSPTADSDQEMKDNMEVDGHAEGAAGPAGAEATSNSTPLPKMVEGQLEETELILKPEDLLTQESLASPPPA